MFNVNRPAQKPVVMIRQATKHELDEYEKNRLANIAENAKEANIECINVSADNNPLLVIRQH